jgi:hypothetical protein
MSLYDVILKELDLNEGDEFKINYDSHIYKFTDSKLYTKCGDKLWCKKHFPINDLFELGIKILKRAPWVPKVGERYFVPEFFSGRLYADCIFTDHMLDHRCVEMKCAFKTPEEAITCAKKMLDAIKED